MRRLLLYLFTTILFSAVLLPVGLAEDKPVNSSCTPGEIKDNDIALFRDNYVPVEFHPEPEYMAYIDLTLLFFVVLTGVVFILTKKRKLTIGFLALFSLLYFGLIRGGCICPVGAVANVCIGVRHPELVGRVTAMLFIIPLFFALILGRVFCTAGCPLGAVQHLAHKKRKFLVLPKWLKVVSIVSSSLILIATMVLAFQRNLFLVCSLDPYTALFFSVHAWSKEAFSFVVGSPHEDVFVWACDSITWLMFFGFLIIGFWIPRPFCRFICPYGVLLGIFSIFSFRKRSIDTTSCVLCGQCEKICPTAAIKIDRQTQTISLSNYHCVQCDRCRQVCVKDAIQT